MSNSWLCKGFQRCLWFPQTLDLKMCSSFFSWSRRSDRLWALAFQTRCYEVERHEHETDHSTVSNAKVKNACSFFFLCSHWPSFRHDTWTQRQLDITMEVLLSKGDWYMDPTLRVLSPALKHPNPIHFATVSSSNIIFNIIFCGRDWSLFRGASASMEYCH